MKKLIFILTISLTTSFTRGQMIVQDLGNLKYNILQYEQKLQEIIQIKNQVETLRNSLKIAKETLEMRMKQIASLEFKDFGNLEGHHQNVRLITGTIYSTENIYNNLASRYTSLYDQAKSLKKIVESRTRFKKENLDEVVNDNGVQNNVAQENLKNVDTSYKRLGIIESDLEKGTELATSQVIAKLGALNSTELIEIRRLIATYYEILSKKEIRKAIEKYNQEEAIKIKLQKQILKEQLIREELPGIQDTRRVRGRW